MSTLHSALLTALLAPALVGCDARPEDDTPDAAPDAAPSLQTLAACPEDDFAPTPFAGPAFDPETGLPLGPLPTPHIVATTAGWARPEPEHQEALGQASGAVSAAVFESPGLLGVSFGGSQACGTARTLSLWADEAALMAFVLGDAHRQAMPIVPRATLGWETTHWTEQSTAPTTWQRAREALAEARPER